MVRRTCQLSRVAVSGLLALLGGACGRSASPPSMPQAQEVPAAQTAPPTPSSESSSDEAQPAANRAGAEVESASSANSTAPSDASAPAESEPEVQTVQSGAPPMRDVLYKVKPWGLVIEAGGVRFRPRAKVKKLKGGALGIELEVRAKSIDDQEHILLNPTHGPLSFAATLYKKNGTQFRYFGDQREGSEQLIIVPGEEVSFGREWPSGNVKGPLFWGQKVRLQVGLWGLGTADEQTKPLKAFCVVELVGGANPRAVISPPEM